MPSRKYFSNLSWAARRRHFLSGFLSDVLNVALRNSYTRLLSFPSAKGRMTVVTKSFSSRLMRALVMSHAAPSGIGGQLENRRPQLVVLVLLCLSADTANTQDGKLRALRGRKSGIHAFMVCHSNDSEKYPVRCSSHGFRGLRSIAPIAGNLLTDPSRRAAYNLGSTIPVCD